MTHSTRTTTMFFDGGCPVCRREVGHYRRLDRAGRVRWVDIHRDPAPLSDWGIEPVAAMQCLHVLDREERIVTGVQAFAAVWSELPYYRWLARLTRLPGVLAVLNAVYRPFARWRYRRRGGGRDAAG